MALKLNKQILYVRSVLFFVLLCLTDINDMFVAVFWEINRSKFVKIW